jgi:FkbM family methyltransferase
MLMHADDLLRRASPAGWRDRLLSLIEPWFEGERAVRVGSDRVFVEGAARSLVALGWKLGWLARRERAAIARLARPGTVSVDVGANVGLTTLALARRVGSAGRVFALEPEADNFRLLSRTLAEVGLAQVEARQLAAADHSGWMTLYVSERDRRDHRIFPVEEDERALATVRAVCLDDLLAQEERVGLVVIDVCGAELSVLRGMRATLARKPAPRILCTLAPALLRRAGVGRDAFFDPLREAGLASWRLEADGAIDPVSPAAAWTLAEARGTIPVYFGGREGA